MTWKTVGVAAYSWIAGQFTFATVQYQTKHKDAFKWAPRPVWYAMPFLAGAGWPLVVALGLPGALRKPERPAPVLVGQKKPTLRVVE